MVRCDKCDIEINYLPFRCKYCGKYFCRDHRLPENHSCTGRFDAPIVVTPKLQKQMGIEIEEPEIRRPGKKLYQDAEDYTREKKGKKFFRQRNSSFSSPKWRRFQESAFGRYMVTHIFLILFVIGYILSIIPATRWFVVLDWGVFFSQFYFQTIVTAVFVPEVGSGFFGIIFLALILFVFYMIGRQLETRFGRKFLIKFVFICGILTGVVFLLSVGLFSLIPGYVVILEPSLGIGTNFGIIIGVIVFFAVLAPQQTLRLMFPPIQLKAKTIAIIFIAIAVGMGFLTWAAFGFDPIASISMCSGLSELGGALGGYLIAKYGRNRIPSRPPPVQFISGY